MGCIKDMLLGIAEQLHPDDFEAQDDLQGRVLSGVGLYADEMERLWAYRKNLRLSAHSLTQTRDYLLSISDRASTCNLEWLIYPTMDPPRIRVKVCR